MMTKAIHVVILMMMLLLLLLLMMMMLKLLSLGSHGITLLRRRPFAKLSHQ